MSNQNPNPGQQNPGQQNQNPSQKPGQQQGGGQKPGQQQQDPSRQGQNPPRASLVRTVSESRKIPPHGGIFLDDFLAIPAWRDRSGRARRCPAETLR